MRRWLAFFVFFIILTTGSAKAEGDGFHKNFKPGEIFTAKFNDYKSSREPNEIGVIPVLMYHNLGSVESRYVRSYENFKKDLWRMYEAGYRPIRLRDLLTGHITTPKGYTPVVLTFDDGNESDIGFEENGEIRSDTAAGILRDFSKSHPDFPPHATFYITKEDRYGDRELTAKKCKALIELGMDIGNHSHTHPKMEEMTPEQIRSEMALQDEFLRTVLPAGYEIDSSSVPRSVVFSTREQEEAMQHGTYGMIRYSYLGTVTGRGALNASPYHTDFDSCSVRRVIPTSDTKMEQITWDYHMSRLESGEEIRFVSDGNPYVITVPEAYRQWMHPRWKSRLQP